MLASWQRTVIIAPHPDDEVLGAGGITARLSALGVDVRVLILTRGEDDAETERNREDTLCAHRILGITQTRFLDYPAAALDRVPHAELNAAILESLQDWQPDALFLPFPGDIHRDHQLVFESSMVAARPNQPYAPTSVLCYETLSETNWNAPFLAPQFTPNVFISIEGFLDKKLKAFEKFSLQVKTPPHERSTRAIKSLARLRGATAHMMEAEAFKLVRHIYSK